MAAPPQGRPSPPLTAAGGEQGGGGEGGGDARCHSLNLKHGFPSFGFLESLRAGQRALDESTGILCTRLLHSPVI